MGKLLYQPLAGVYKLYRKALNRGVRDGFDFISLSWEMKLFLKAQRTSEVWVHSDCSIEQYNSDEASAGLGEIADPAALPLKKVKHALLKHWFVRMVAHSVNPRYKAFKWKGY